jgi:hypothetical protein
MRIIICLVALLFASGCVTRSIELPNGVKYSSTSFLTNPNVGQVKVVGGKDHIDFSLAGYAHDQTAVAELILAIAQKKATP